MPTVEHLLQLAQDADVKHASTIVDEVRSAVTRFADFADAARVPPKLRKQIAATIRPLVDRAVKKSSR